MISVTTKRFGPFVVAANVNDFQEVSLAIGLTAESATRRLIEQVSA